VRGGRALLCGDGGGVRLDCIEEMPLACDHSDTAPSNATGPPCRWCGKPIANARAWLCGECNRPARCPGYITTGISIAITSLLLPVVLAIFTFQLGANQQTIASRQKLADAYVAFGTTMTDYRRAAATLDVLSSVAPRDAISFPDLRKSILDYDAAFNAIGAKLGPFQEAARRSSNVGGEAGTWAWLSLSGAGPSEAAIDEISTTWNNCFVEPYYGGTASVPYEKSYWYKIQEQLKLCSSETCPHKVAADISSIMFDAYSGTCICDRPVKQRPMHWLYPTMQNIIEGRNISYPSHADAVLAKPNPDLANGNNEFCKAKQ
jgi:hypothetical protein